MTWVRIERPDGYGGLEGFAWVFLDAGFDTNQARIKADVERVAVAFAQLSASDQGNGPFEVSEPHESDLADFLRSDEMRIAFWKDLEEQYGKPFIDELVVRAAANLPEKLPTSAADHSLGWLGIADPSPKR